MVHWWKISWLYVFGIRKINKTSILHLDVVLTTRGWGISRRNSGASWTIPMVRTRSCSVPWWTGRRQTVDIPRLPYISSRRNTRPNIRDALRRPLSLRPSRSPKMTYFIDEWYLLETLVRGEKTPKTNEYLKIYTYEYIRSSILYECVTRARRRYTTTAHNKRWRHTAAVTLLCQWLSPLLTTVTLPIRQKLTTRKLPS